MHRTFASGLRTDGVFREGVAAGRAFDVTLLSNDEPKGDET